MTANGERKRLWNSAQGRKYDGSLLSTGFLKFIYPLILEYIPSRFLRIYVHHDCNRTVFSIPNSRQVMSVARMITCSTLSAQRLSSQFKNRICFKKRLTTRSTMTRVQTTPDQPMLHFN